ncbi:MAG: cytoplasmic protein [Deltaproteobacteria bacterium]|nr:cytoplasmic protein [Deltaproteobacteria bacterium]
MRVGAALLEIRVHGSHSLKQKRGVIRSIVQRLRNRHNVSVAEVGGQGTWQRAVIGLAAVGQDALMVRKRLEAALSFVESLNLAEVMASDIEMLDTPPVAALEEDEAAEGLPWEEDTERVDPD